MKSLICAVGAGVVGLGLLLGQPQLAQAGNSQGTAFTSAAENANFGYRGPYYYYSTARAVADYLECCGYATEVVYSGGYWYVAYC
jgi:hypothetical protein